MKLQAILNPLGWSDFTCHYLGKKPYVSLSQNRNFDELLTWNEINRILLEHRLEHPRLRMFKNVQLVPASNYINRTTSRRGSVSPTILIKEFNEEVLNGATLIIDAIQEMSPKIRDLCDNFNFSLKGICQANAYIALADQQAFDTHWDGHDVFVLQISGEKHWKIYHPTRLYPLDTDLDKPSNLTTPEEKQVFWEGTIKAGDTLYIPRGWWHSVSPVGKETIHISVGYNPPTGVDYMKWISNRLLQEEDFRAASPIFSDDVTKKMYTDRIHALISQYVNINSYDKHIEDRIGKLSPRVPPAMPYSADPKITKLPSSIKVKPSHRSISVKPLEKSIKITTFNKRYEFSHEYADLINILFGDLNEEGLSISQVKLHCPSVSEGNVHKFIIFLMRLGLLQIC